MNHQNEDPAKYMTLQKLQSLEARLEEECKKIKTKISNTKLKNETRKILRDKLLELEKTQLEIRNLEERLARL